MVGKIFFSNILSSNHRQEKIKPTSSEITTFQKMVQTNTNFANLSVLELKMHLQDRIQALDLKDDYVTALIFTEVNPKAICLFSDEIRSRLAKETEKTRSDSATISIESYSESSSISSGDTESVLSFTLDSFINPPLGHTALKAAAAFTSAQAAAEDLVNPTLEEAPAQNVRIEPQGAETTVQSLILPIQGAPEERSVEAEVIKDVPASSVKIEQRESETASQSKEARLEKTIDTKEIKELTDLADEFLTALAPYKKILLMKNICEAFPEHLRNYVFEVLRSPDPVLSILLKEASNIDDGNVNVWIDTIKAHIKSQNSHQFISLSKNWVFERFMEKFGEHEQEIANKAFFDPSIQKSLNQALMQKIPLGTIAASLIKKCNNAIIEKTLLNHIFEIIKPEARTLAIDMLNSPSKITLGFLKSYKKEKNPQERENLRFMLTLNLIQELTDVGSKPKILPRPVLIDTIVKTAIQNKDPSLLRMLSSKEEKLVTEDEVNEIYSGYAISQAHGALNEGKPFYLEKQYHHLIPKEIMDRLIESRIDLDAEDDL